MFIDLITQLPKDIVCTLLISWIDLRDLCRVDSAYCSYSLRVIFLTILSSDQFIYEDMPIHYMAKVPPYIEWSVLRNVHVNTADLSSNISHSLLQRFVKNCTTKNVKCIALHEFSSDSKIFNTLSKECSQLKDIILHSCHFGKSINFMLKGLRALTAMSIEHCRSLKPSQFKAVQCPDLRVISLVKTECNDASLAAVILMAASALEKLVCNESFGFSSAGLINALYPVAKNLRVLGLGGLLEVSDDTIVSLVPHCPQLEVIDLADCEQLTNVSIIAICTSCERIERLYLHHNNNYTDEALSYISHRCIKLIALHVSHCSGVTYLGVCNVLDHCRKLDTLYIGGRRLLLTEELMVIVSKCAHLTYKLSISTPYLLDEVVIAIGKVCKNLQHLDLHCCNGYSERGVLFVAASNYRIL